MTDLDQLRAERDIWKDRRLLEMQEQAKQLTALREENRQLQLRNQELARTSDLEFPGGWGSERSALTAERDALKKFKEYVHKRLDDAGVPHDPDPEHNAKHGCRVEGRLNYLQAQLTAALSMTGYRELRLRAEAAESERDALRLMLERMNGHFLAAEAREKALREALEEIYACLNKGSNSVGVQYVLAVASNALAPSPKPPEAASTFTKEWCERAAELEGDSHVGAGIPLELRATPKAEAAREKKHDRSCASFYMMQTGSSEWEGPHPCNCSLSRPPPTNETCPRCAEYREALEGLENSGDPTLGLSCAVCGETEHDEPRHLATCIVGKALRAALSNGGEK